MNKTTGLLGYQYFNFSINNREVSNDLIPTVMRRKLLIPTGIDSYLVAL